MISSFLFLAGINPLFELPLAKEAERYIDEMFSVL